MLEPHLEDIKHKENQNFDILNTQPIESFSTPHYNEKTGGLLLPPDTCSKPAWETFGRPNR
jgi:hypothetical protein